MKGLVHILLPAGSHAEFRRARELLKEQSDWTFRMGSAVGHTPGQRLYGDVVVVGNVSMPTIEQDAQGKVWRVDNIEGLKDLSLDDDTPRPKPAEPVVMEPETPAPDQPQMIRQRADPKQEPEPEPKPEQAPQDELEEMSRVELIGHASKRWPGQRNWAALTNLGLRETIRQLSQRK